ncbi:hypothetical protein BGZ58_007719 [Dissophora ornata]|nr:hypothetical protein BGZ58_007719 [Dissophora ornata]
MFGIWLLIYRNRGFNRKIVTELFLSVGTGIRPKPMDCIIFFTTIACFVKVPANTVLILDVLRDSLWLRIAIDQLYWAFVAFAFCSYFVGLLYAMPVTTREGIFAVYRPETAYGSKPLTPIHVLTPTTVQKNIMLVMGAIYPAIIGAGTGLASGALQDHGYDYASWIMMVCQYANWVLIMYFMAIMFFYYGLKYTFILRANIIIAETALKAPRAAFGIGNLKSRSPARFLFIQLQITGFGGCAVTILAGTLCLSWVLFRKQILEMKNDQLPHTIAFFWTGAMAVAYVMVYALITAQTVRNRRRGLHDPSSTISQYAPSSGNGSGSLQRQGSVRQSSNGSKESKHVMSRFDSEACLTQGSSIDVSTLHSIVSIEKRAANEDDLEAAGGVESDRESYKAPSLMPPPRPQVLSLGSTGSTTADPNHSHIRESVFGGRTPREDTSSKASSPPQSPTSPGFSLPSFPLASLRSGSRNSVLPRPSTSSASGSPYHTTSISTTGGSSRLSLNSLKCGGSSSNSYNISSVANSTTPVYPTSPTNPNVRWSYQLQQPTSPLPVYNPQPTPLPQPLPQLGGAVRKQSNAGITPKTSAVSAPVTPASLPSPIPAPASRGAGGGYRSQGAELEANQYQQLQMIQHQQRQQQQQQQQQQSVASENNNNRESGETWPLPPTFKK